MKVKRAFNRLRKQSRRRGRPNRWGGGRRRGMRRRGGKRRGMRRRGGKRRGMRRRRGRRSYKAKCAKGRRGHYCRQVKKHCPGGSLRCMPKLTKKLCKRNNARRCKRSIRRNLTKLRKGNRRGRGRNNRRFRRNRRRGRGRGKKRITCPKGKRGKLCMQLRKVC